MQSHMHANILKNIHSSFINYAFQIETTQMFDNWWLHKPGSRYSHRVEKRRTGDSCHNVEWCWKHYYKQKKVSNILQIMGFHL